MTIKQKHRKVIILIIIVTALACLLTVTAFAITESEVEAQVSTQGRETVSGNVFIWFLCAIAFLKISQKIASFMSSLGINVGNTGGSMVAEMMLAGRAISGVMGKSGFGRSGGVGGASSGSSASGGGTANPLQGGLAGAVSRKVQGGSVTNATDASASKPSGGIMTGIGGKVFQSSLNKGGDYANNVIGAVAKGNISQMGSITGDKAASALRSYMNVGGAENTANSNVNISSDISGGSVSVDNSVQSGIPSAPLEGADPGFINTTSGSVIASQPEGSEIPDAGVVDRSGIHAGQVAPELTQPSGVSDTNGIPSSPVIPVSTEAVETGGVTPVSGVGAATMSGTIGSIPVSPSEANYSVSSSPQSAGVPEYSGVEIGGGRIIGYETPVGGGETREFAMYSADQYTRPDGSHDVATSVDGSKWYRQYAQPAVEKTPYRDETNAIQFNEKIVQKLPQPPRRKDRV